VKRFIFSSAQNGTDVHDGFMDNLEAYAEHLGAKIYISGFTYNKALFEDHSKEIAPYHPRVAPYLTKDQLEVSGRLLFCGEQNTLPTADQPLSGFEAYTREKWGIFPHPRVQLRSIPTLFHAAPKIIMTTGAVTKKNYIQKKAGIKAEFHHIIGAVLVEVDADGDVFCRHLLADKAGNFQDLTTRVEGGKVLADKFPVEAVTWGDIHTDMLDPEVALGAWGLDVEGMETVSPSSMLNELEPRYQFFHDVIDFRRRNHHNIDDPHHLFEMWCKETDRVEDEFIAVGCFLHATARPWCQSYVIDSNHDRALNKWLKRADYRKDPANARFFLECQAEMYAAIEEHRQHFIIAEWAIRNMGGLNDDDPVTFLDRTDSFTICNGTIECALHGDQGANGAKGHVNSFARMGPKANTADKHGAEILEGIYQAGHSCKRDMVYNRGGLTSWNHSHIVTYPNGKRTIITMVGRKWRGK
jgi:hypothetical protein